MFLRVNRNNIIEGVQKSANIIPAKTGAAYLRTIWIKGEEQEIKIMSTDSNLEFCGQYPADVQEQGLAGIQGRSFHDLVRKLPKGEISFKSESDGQSVLVEQGSRKYKLAVNDPNWFQQFSEYPEEGSVLWSGDILHEIIDKISFCVSDEDSMEAIACMYMTGVEEDGEQQIEVCGLNGHQFSMVRFVNDDIYNLLPEDGILIQKRYLLELKKWLTTDEVEMNISDKRLFFRTGDKKETFSFPLSFYQYPNYKNFINKLGGDDLSVLKTNREELIQALERISIFNTDSDRCANMMFNPAEVVLFSQGQDVGTATEALEAEYSGSLEKIGFPTKNLIEILNKFSSSEVSLTLSGVEAPCGVQSEEDQNYLVIIMPMKIEEETYYSEEEV